jgi:hypothetical protein
MITIQNATELSRIDGWEKMKLTAENLENITMDDEFNDDNRSVLLSLAKFKFKVLYLVSVEYIHFFIFKICH